MSVRSTSAIRLLEQRLLLGLANPLRPAGTPATEGGLTLLECLIAIVVVSITLVSITPPIFWATATRVQNRRAEQAQQLAQAEIDRIRTLVERGNRYEYTQLPPDGGANIRTSSPAAPTSSTGRLRAQSPGCNADTGVQPTLLQFMPISTKGPENTDCTPDFFIQTFRSTGQWADTANRLVDPPDGFVMGVRVYSAFASVGALEKERASLQGTSGLGNQRTRPLAVLYSVIVRNNSNKSLEIYRQLCPTTGTGSSAPPNGC
jgi:type II secretory pathway pseudopilin PulG